MNSSDRTPAAGGDAVDLNQHLSWMRSLARALVRDEALAEDLVQDAAVAALEPKARRPMDVRGWLGTVLRNRARDVARRSGARTAREAEVARPEAGPQLDELGSRAAMGAELSQRVLALGEPMRSTLLMRYWDDLPPRAIAKRTGVPVSTVKSRLARGLERLRRDLDESRGGDRRAWLVVVLPLARKTPWIAAPAAAGWTAMNSKTIVAATAAVMAGGALMLARGTNAAPVLPDLPQDRGEEEARAERRGSSPGGIGFVSTESRGQERVAAGRTVEAEEAAPDAATFEVIARVLDGSARPMGGVELRLEGTDVVGRTASDGRATLVTAEATGTLVAADGSLWVTVRPGVWREGRDVVPLVVVAPSLRIDGRVIDSFCHAVEGASVDVWLPADFLNRFDGSFGASTRSGWTTTSSEEGQFAFDRAPGVEGAKLQVSAEGFEAAILDCPQLDTSGFEVVLKRPAAPEASRLRGRVLRADGRPATRARVGLGMETVAADEQGLFEIDLARTGPSANTLVAIEAGSLTGELPRPEGEPEGPRRGWPDYVEVTLGAEPLRITGVVVDQDGKPLEGARVWLDDPSSFGTLGIFPIQREALAAGLEPSRDAVRSIASIGAGSDEQHGTATAVGDPNASFAWTATDAEGRFRLDGLEDRRYVLNVAGPSLEYGLQTDPIDAGERGVEITVDTADLYETLSGRVVTANGDGVPGAWITPWVSALTATIPVLDGTSDVTRYFYSKGTRTDDEGYFTLKNVPKRWLQFYIAGNGVIPGYASVDDVVDSDDFEIEIEVRVEVVVTVSDAADPIDGVRAFNALGEPRSIYSVFADGYSTMVEAPIVNGKSGSLSMATDVSELVFLSGGVEQGRSSVTLRPGERMRVDY